MPISADSTRGRDPRAAWSGADLKRPGVALAAAAVLLASAVLSFNVSCQVHEVGHAVVASALGWSVEQIHFCVPAGGRVEYAMVTGGAWADAAESYAGGLAGALFLVTVYVAVFCIPRTPLRGPAWWAAGFGPPLWVGSQLMVGVVEGSVRDRDYGEVLDAHLPQTLAVIGVTMVIAAVVHIWLWRSVWRR